MNEYSKNLEVLVRTNIALAKKIHTLCPTGVQVGVARSGDPNLEEQDFAGTWNSLHSNYNPRQEARNRAENVVLDPGSLCLVLGFGAGYLLEALLERDAAEDIRFLVLEPNPSVFKEALRARDLTHILSRPNVQFYVGQDLESVSQSWEALPLARRMQPPRVVQHFASVKSHASFFKSVLELIHRQVCRSKLDFDNLANSSRRFFDNLVGNMSQFLGDPGIKELEGLFENQPAILVSAGPSLDKNIACLAELGNRAVLIAVDAAVKPLLARGIEPHFIVTVDPGPANHEHLKGTQTTRSCLVFEASVFPDSMNQFRGRRFVAYLEDSFYQFLLDQVEDKGQLRGWGSVSTLAFSLARLLYCDPILFVGQDLAFTDGRIYCHNITYQNAWLANVGSEQELLTRYDEHVRAQNPLLGMDLFGGQTLTTTRLQSYAQWLEEEVLSTGDVRCINATEGGILGAGMEKVSLREALFRHCRDEMDVWDRLERFARKPAATNKLHRFVRKTSRHLEWMRESCTHFLRRLDELVRKDNPKESEIRRDLQHKWDQFQKRAFRYRDTARILEFFNQPAIRQFLSTTTNQTQPQEEIERYRDFVHSILECIGYLDSRLDELATTVCADTASKEKGSRPAVSGAGGSRATAS